jgi:hypothetical protein
MALRENERIIASDGGEAMAVVGGFQVFSISTRGKKARSIDDFDISVEAVLKPRITSEGKPWDNAAIGHQTELLNSFGYP